MSCLMTLTDWLMTHPDASLWPETPAIPTVTQQALIDYFQLRRVCDNDHFDHFFRRQVWLYGSTYLELLRLETVDIDPMVADYMERQINHMDESRDSSSSTRTATGTQSGDSRTVTDGESSRKSSGNDYRTGSDKTVSSDTTDGTVRTTDGGSDKTSESRTASSNQKTEEQHNDTTDESLTGDRQSLSGATPDSSTYHTGGFPATLNWQYTSGQQETKDVSDKLTDSSGCSTTETSGSDSGETDRTTTYGKTQTRTDSTQKSGTSNTTRTDSGSQESQESTTNDQTVTGTDSRTTSDKSEQTDNRDHSGNDETRERYSGRHEAPQDLLSRAWSFVLKANSTRWLIERLDSCFLAIFDY